MMDYLDKVDSSYTEEDYRRKAESHKQRKIVTVPYWVSMNQPHINLYVYTLPRVTTYLVERFVSISCSNIFTFDVW